jgi:replicative DNA helicase
LAANIELQLICKIIELQDFHTVVKLKIDESFFLSDSQTKEAFRFIKEHFHNEHTYGSVPSWQLLQQRFWGFPWAPSYDTVPTLCQELRRQKLRAQLLSLTDDLITRSGADPLSALESLKEAAARMTAEHELSNDMLLSSAYEQLYEDYQLTASGHGITGIPWPWDVMNEDTQGIHPGNFLVLYGRPKSMKTWVALYVAVNAYMKGQRVLIFSLEMTEKQVMRRVACIICGVDYDNFKKGKLDPGSQQKVWQALMLLKDEEKNRVSADGHSPSILVVRPNGEASGVTTLHAKIREFSPDFVLVDGMYLMRDDRQRSRNIDWKSIAHISQDLKRTALQFDIPLMATTQANKQAEKDPRKADLMEIAYADALGQDCDLAMRVTKQKDQATHEFEIVISLPGSREGTLEGFVINGIAATNFNFKRATMVDPNNPNNAGAPSSGNPQSNSGKAGGRNPPPIAVNYRT